MKSEMEMDHGNGAPRGPDFVITEKSKKFPKFRKNTGCSETNHVMKNDNSLDVENSSEIFSELLKSIDDSKREVQLQAMESIGTVHIPLLSSRSLNSSSLRHVDRFFSDWINKTF